MTFDGFLDLIRRVTDIDARRVEPTTALRDSGLDSLALVLLLLHAEEHGVPLPEDLIESWQTIGDVFDQIGKWYEGAGPPDDGWFPQRTGGRGRGSDPLDVLAVEGRHVFTEPVGPQHVPLLHRIASGPRNAFAWWPRGRTVSLAEFEDRLWHDVVLQEVVVDRSSLDVLGFVRIADYNERDGHAQLMVLGLHSRRSWLLEGVVLALGRAFTMWPLRKLYLMVPGFNDGLVVPRTSLLREEGSCREHEYFDGKYWDLHVYALYRSDFFERWSDLQGGGLRP